MYTFFMSLLGSFMAPKVIIALGGVSLNPRQSRTGGPIFH